MKHRDPNLFYLTMEVTVRRWSGVPVRALLVLEDSARPAQLALCRPSGDLRFVLQMRRGGVIKVHDTVLMPGSQYKSLLVSYRTTSEETVQLLLNCYGRRESKNYFAIHEVCQLPLYRDRRLDQTERPLEVKAEWPKDRRAEYVFVLRRNMTQALSLRKISVLTGEIRRGTEGAAGNRPSSTKDGSEGTLRGRSLSPSRSSTDADDAVIDCTCTTPVMTLIKNYNNNCLDANEWQNFGHPHGPPGYYDNYIGSHNHTWRESQVDDSRPKVPFLKKFDITYPLTCYRRNDITKIQSHSQNKSVTFNLTNSVPMTRKNVEDSTTNSLPKTQKEFQSSQNISSVLNSIQARHKVIPTTDKFLTDYASYEAKFAKTLDKLNPHVQNNENYDSIELKFDNTKNGATKNNPTDDVNNEVTLPVPRTSISVCNSDTQNLSETIIQAPAQSASYVESKEGLQDLNNQIKHNEESTKSFQLKQYLPESKNVRNNQTEHNEGSTKSSRLEQYIPESENVRYTNFINKEEMENKRVDSADNGRDHVMNEKKADYPNCVDILLMDRKNGGYQDEDSKFLMDNNGGYLGYPDLLEDAKNGDFTYDLNKELSDIAKNILDFRNKMLSSAVQTELTCIPIKGLKYSGQRWNSVETLLDEYKKPEEKAVDTPVQAKHTEISSPHQDGKQCEHQCKNCFYI